MLTNHSGHTNPKHQQRCGKCDAVIVPTGQQMPRPGDAARVVAVICIATAVVLAGILSVFLINRAEQEAHPAPTGVGDAAIPAVGAAPYNPQYGQRARAACFEPSMPTTTGAGSGVPLGTPALGLCARCD